MVSDQKPKKRKKKKKKKKQMVTMCFIRSCAISAQLVIVCYQILIYIKFSVVNKLLFFCCLSMKIYINEKKGVERKKQMMGKYFCLQKEGIKGDKFQRTVLLQFAANLLWKKINSTPKIIGFVIDEFIMINIYWLVKRLTTRRTSWVG